jgi:hypothetical protein
MLKVTYFFELRVLEFLLLVLLLVLLLLEGTYVVAPLPTNRAGIGGARKNKTKWGNDVS